MSTVTKEEMVEMIVGLEEKVSVLKHQMEEGSKALVKEPVKYESAETNKLAEALAKAQLEMEEASQKLGNSYFKSQYADLDEIIRASRPALGKHGLYIMQRIIPKDDEISYLYTRVMHLSGQWMESKVRLKADKDKQNIQGFGSAITYMRRYSYNCMIGVVGIDQDDDGNAAVKAEKDEPALISQTQLSILAEELEGETEMLAHILKSLRIKKLSQMKLERYKPVLNNIRDRKMRETQKQGA